MKTKIETLPEANQIEYERLKENWGIKIAENYKRVILKWLNGNKVQTSNIPKPRDNSRFQEYPYRGKMMSATEIGHLFNLSATTVRKRIREALAKGMTNEEAVLDAISKGKYYKPVKPIF